MFHPTKRGSPAGLIIAAPASGSGKTTITLGLLRALRKQGRPVAAFKTGPDYIDSAFHTAALGEAGGACVNLDGWAMDDRMIGGLLVAHMAHANLVIGEGAMGLFDGANGINGTDAAGRGDGSTADLARRLALPVILVIDAKGQGASIAALVQGFAHFRPDVIIAGVILNRVSGDSHAALLRAALARLDYPMPVFGALPDDPSLALPSRHLGLVQAGEHAALEDFLDRAAVTVARHLDLDAIVRSARPVAKLAAGDGVPIAPLGQRIAVARDEAFAFAYPAVIEGWRRAGAEVTVFSPLADDAVADMADGVFLPGGYPELHAARLARNHRFLDSLRHAAARGSLVYGECGGYMVLGEALIDAAGTSHAMAGLLPVVTSFAARRLHLGYRQVEIAASESPFGKLGRRWRGHEFHYATVVRENPYGNGLEPLYKTSNACGNSPRFQGLRLGSVMGSFVHLIAAAERG